MKHLISAFMSLWIVLNGADLDGIFSLIFAYPTKEAAIENAFKYDGRYLIHVDNKFKTKIYKITWKKPKVDVTLEEVRNEDID